MLKSRPLGTPHKIDANTNPHRVLCPLWPSSFHQKIHLFHQRTRLPHRETRLSHRGTCLSLQRSHLDTSEPIAYQSLILQVFDGRTGPGWHFQADAKQDAKTSAAPIMAPILRPPRPTPNG